MPSNHELKTIISLHLSNVRGGTKNSGGKAPSNNAKVAKNTNAANSDSGGSDVWKWISDNGPDIVDSFIPGEFSTFILPPELMKQVMPTAQKA